MRKAADDVLRRVQGIRAKKKDGKVWKGEKKLPAKTQKLIL